MDMNEKSMPFNIIINTVTKKLDTTQERLAAFISSGRYEDGDSNKERKAGTINKHITTLKDTQIVVFYDNDKQYKKFNEYVRWLCIGICSDSENAREIENNTVVGKIINELIKEVKKISIETKKLIEIYKKEKQSMVERYTAGVKNLQDVIFDFLSRASLLFTMQDAEMVEAEEYDKYIFISRQETFMLKGKDDDSVTEMGFRIIESPIENKVYFIMISTDYDLTIEEHPCIKDALSNMMSYINKEDEVDMLPDIYHAPYKYHSKRTPEVFETMSSFSKKLERLLSQS